ncbi:hypothetical protein [Caballeronia ptereochthonis]|nr:hypothetical protein [Caballeronia ptereochthonis]
MQHKEVLWFAGGELAIMLIMSLMILSLRKAPVVDRSHDTRLLYFAAVILTALGLIFMFSMAMYFWEGASENQTPGPGQDIFRQCSQVIPPIVTLVLGYFFGRQESSEHKRRADGGGGPPQAGPESD